MSKATQTAQATQQAEQQSQYLATRRGELLFLTRNSDRRIAALHAQIKVETAQRALLLAELNEVENKCEGADIGRRTGRPDVAGVPATGEQTGSTHQMGDVVNNGGIVVQGAEDAPKPVKAGARAKKA